MSASGLVDGPLAPASRTVAALPAALLRTARPRQWVKNVLVLAAPFAAGSLTDRTVAVHTLLTALAFCLTASGTYFVNDAADVARDRAHPTKRFRPVAVGLVPVNVARAIGVASMAAGVALAVLVSVATGGVLASYAFLTLAYSTWLKHVPVVDVVAVASGFLLRCVSGAVAARVPVSGAFLLLASFGALFLVVGKREGERIELGRDACEHRSSLAAYTTPFTAQLLSLSLTATVLSYAAWAFTTDTGEAGPPWVALSVVPFVIAMLRATQLVLAGRGASPEELFLRDRGLQSAALATGLLLAVALYVV